MATPVAHSQFFPHYADDQLRFTAKLTCSTPIRPDACRFSKECLQDAAIGKHLVLDPLLMPGYR